ncbi:hypothetical protein BSZ14_00830 [Sphingomonas sp. Sph1(2015)]|jgi:hypothetical protein|uniref:hypothetical protein n=1 Tax=Sphingomonas sp. Sph1(2015) TaxID=1628084 RepID=UPI0009763B28|nr:hypothetical protein [Sphingomonas sp. Sph1(2015)]OMJ33996.1 hypothetical protein BSZ14_00830 [Sphingomonas sp. Sph1(2015)]
MPRAVADYIALALIADLQEDSDWLTAVQGEFSGDLEQLKSRAQLAVGFAISDDLLGKVIRAMADCKLIRVTDDDFSGTFVKIKSKGFAEFIRRAREEEAKAEEEDGPLAVMARPSDYPNASALLKHELFEDYHELGSGWLKRAIDGLRRKVEEDGVPSESAFGSLVEAEVAPGSDRIVSFSDNQVSELEKKTGEIIDEVAAQNQIDGDPGLREIILGQLKAGRELIRAGTFRLYFLELTLIETLKFLAKRYEREAIGGLASALIAALAKHIGIDG